MNRFAVCSTDSASARRCISTGSSTPDFCSGVSPSAPQKWVACIASSRSWSKETLTSIIISMSSIERPAFSAPSAIAGISVSV